jgi:hypothetical protein
MKKEEVRMKNETPPANDRAPVIFLSAFRLPPSTF